MRNLNFVRWFFRLSARNANASFLKWLEMKSRPCGRERCWYRRGYFRTRLPHQGRVSQKRRRVSVSYDGVTRGMKLYNKYKDLTQKKARKIKISDKCHGLTISSVKNGKPFYEEMDSQLLFYIRREYVFWAKRENRLACVLSSCVGGRTPPMNENAAGVDI